VSFNSSEVIRIQRYHTTMGALSFTFSSLISSAKCGLSSEFFSCLGLWVLSLLRCLRSSKSCMRWRGSKGEGTQSPRLGMAHLRRGLDGLCDRLMEQCCGLQCLTEHGFIYTEWKLLYKWQIRKYW
jgi:hypothetical protein